MRLFACYSLFMYQEFILMLSARVIGKETSRHLLKCLKCNRYLSENTLQGHLPFLPYLKKTRCTINSELEELQHLLDLPLQARLYEWRKDNTNLRNTQMQEWAAQRSEAHGGNVLYLDFNHLATTENAPQGIGSMNW